jgi:hypothetical protein
LQLWKRAYTYVPFTITRVAREEREIISIPKTAEKVSFLVTSSYPINVPAIPLDYVDKHVDVTETSIASENGLNPFETTSIMHVELCPEPLLVLLVRLLWVVLKHQ